MASFQNTKWKSLAEKLKSFATHLDTKKQSVKIIVRNQISQLDDDIHSLSLRWESTKESKLESMQNKKFRALDQFLSESDDLIDRSKELHINCAYLCVERNRSSMLEQLYQDIMIHVEGEVAINDFQNEKARIYQTKWMEFSPTVLEEFITRWKAQVQSSATTMFTVHISEEVSNIEEFLFQVLKYCSWDIYEKEHWAEMLYEILGVKRHISLKDVTLSDVIFTSNDVSMTDVLSLLQALQKR